jgi:hypothetical protein
LKSSKTGEVRFLSGGINHYLVVIALIVGLGSLIGLLITPDLLLIILRFFSYIGKQIAELFILLAELFPANSISDIPVDNGIPEIPATREEPWQVWQWFRMSPDLRDTLRRIFVTLFSIGVLFSLYRMFESILQWIKRQATPDITLESLPGSSFSSIIRSILYSIYSTVHWFISWIYLHVSSHTRKDYRNDSIRHIYRNFLRWSASRGYERLVNETPFEFRTKLESMMPPQERLLLNEISEAYVIARYRPKSDIIESLNQVKIAWKKLSRYKFKRNRLSLIQNTNN